MSLRNERPVRDISVASMVSRYILFFFVGFTFTGFLQRRRYKVADFIESVLNKGFYEDSDWFMNVA